MKSNRLLYEQSRAQYQALFDMFDKVGVPPDTHWRSFILYLRSIKKYSHLSDAQKAEIQDLLRESLEKRDFTDASLMAILDRYRQAIVRPYQDKVEDLLREVKDLIASFQRTLQSRSGDITALEDEAVSIITDENNTGDSIEHLRSAFGKFKTLLEHDINSLECLANHDALTGIANRRAFDAFIAKVLEQWQNESRPLCLALFDIDHFKRFNDEHGHRIGDQVLVVVAKHIASMTKMVGAGNEALAARYGGEEFVFLISGPDAPKLCEYVERCRAAIRKFNFLIRDARGNVVESGLHITMSAGVSMMWSGWVSSLQENLLDGADKALYFAKESGRDKGVLFEPGEQFGFTLLEPADAGHTIEETRPSLSDKLGV